MRVHLFGLISYCCISQCAFADTDLEAAQTVYQQQCQMCHGANAAQEGLIPKLAGQQASYLDKALQDYQAGLTGPRPQAIMAPISQHLSRHDITNLTAYLSTLSATNGAVDPAWRKQGEKLYRLGDTQRHIPACAACHGPAGAGNFEAVYPQLAGQNSAYIVQQLQLFAANKRHSDPQGMMRDIASQLTDADQQALASFINGLRPDT